MSRLPGNLSIPFCHKVPMVATSPNVVEYVHLPERPAKCKTYKSEPITPRPSGPADDNQGNFFFDQGIPGMDNRSAARSMTLSEKETENEANRLIEQVEVALAAVALRSPDSDESLESSADRIERAARDLGDVLRQLAKERRADVEDT